MVGVITFSEVISQKGEQPNENVHPLRRGFILDLLVHVLQTSEAPIDERLMDSLAVRFQLRADVGVDLLDRLNAARSHILVTAEN